MVCPSWKASSSQSRGSVKFVNLGGPELPVDHCSHHHNDPRVFLWMHGLYYEFPYSTQTRAKAGFGNVLIRPRGLEGIADSSIVPSAGPPNRAQTVEEPEG